MPWEVLNKSVRSEYFPFVPSIHLAARGTQGERKMYRTIAGTYSAIPLLLLEKKIVEIHQAQDQAGIALDSAMDMIADALSKAAIQPPLAVKAPGSVSVCNDNAEQG